MMRRTGRPSSRGRGTAYFIRRGDDADCAVIALHPDDREEIVASGLTMGDAEDLCAIKIEEKRVTGPAALFDPGPGLVASIKRRRRARQLAFTFE
jgi:hypothetical protein